jgi:endonuclease/exonuclease/phosphatase family metal-dependent hydrolase
MVDTLKILTYNIHKGFSVGNRQFILPDIRAALLATQADILCLQEIQGTHTHKAKKIAHWPALSQYEFIAEQDWPFYIYAKNAVYAAGDHGNAILSKYRFTRWENINLSAFRWASRSMLHGVMCLPPSNTEIHIICIHFGLGGKERQRQIASLCQRIDNHVPQAAPLIIAGDFNDWQQQAEQLLHGQLHLQEVFQVLHAKHAYSFPAWLPLLAMDRIYYRGLIPLACERLSQAPWHLLSDHTPLTATFALPT